MKTVTLWPLGYGYSDIFRCSATGLEELWICGSRGLECRPFFAPSWEMCRIKMLKESWLFFVKFGMDKGMSIKKYFTSWTAVRSLLCLLENVLYSKVHLKSFGKCVDETARLPPIWPGSIPYSTLRSGWICWFPALPQEDFPLGIPIFPWVFRFSPLTKIQHFIGHFGKYHNTFCLSPQILHKHCFQFLLGITMVRRENKNNAHAKFWGTNKEYYGIFRTGLFAVFLSLSAWLWLPAMQLVTVYIVFPVCFFFRR